MSCGEARTALAGNWLFWRTFLVLLAFSILWAGFRRSVGGLYKFHLILALVELGPLVGALVGTSLG